MLYIVTPPYVFLKRRGRLIYDDALVFGHDWDRLPPPPRLAAVTRARKKALAARR